MNNLEVEIKMIKTADGKYEVTFFREEGKTTYMISDYRVAWLRDRLMELGYKPYIAFLDSVPSVTFAYDEWQY